LVIAKVIKSFICFCNLPNADNIVSVAVIAVPVTKDNPESIVAKTRDVVKYKFKLPSGNASVVDAPELPPSTHPSSESQIYSFASEPDPASTIA